MEETNLVLEGVKFMILGMGTVFLFLGIMILVMNIMSKIIHKYFPEVDPSVPPVKVSGTEDKKKVVAAIVAAIIEDKKSQA
jgi:oxaloacetate decarboxylase gamma subunit